MLGILRVLASNGPLTVTELSHLLKVHKSQISRIVDQLERAGYIAKERVGRSVRVSLIPCFSPVAFFPHDAFFPGQDLILCSLHEALRSSKYIQLRGGPVIGKEAAVVANAVLEWRERGNRAIFITPTIMSRENLIRELISALGDEEYLLVDAFSISEGCPYSRQLAEAYGWDASDAIPPHLCSARGFKARPGVRKCPFATKEAMKAARELSHEIRGAYGIPRYRNVELEDLVEFASSRGVCPYLLQRMVMARADFVVADFNHLVLARSMFDGANVFVNEADLLPWRLVNLATVRIGRQVLELDAPRGVKDALDRIRRLIEDHSSEVSEEFSPPGAVIGPDDGTFREFISELVRATRSWTKRLLEENRPPNTPVHSLVNRLMAVPLAKKIVLALEVGERGLELLASPAHPAYLLARPFRGMKVGRRRKGGARRVVFYSATLPTRYSEFLGIRRYANLEGRLPSARERLDVIVPLPPLTYSRQGEVVDAYRRFIQGLSEYEPLIVIATRRIADLVLPEGFVRVSRPPITEEYGRRLEEMLGEPFLTLTPHGFASRGEDLVMERPLVAVVSVPMPPPSPLREALRREYAEILYRRTRSRESKSLSYRTYYYDVGVVAAVQAARRFKRSPGQRLAVAWLDRRWGSPYALSIMGSDIQVTTSSPGEVVEIVRRYYDGSEVI